MNKNILLLALCQAVYMTGVSLVVAAAGLIGEQLSPYPIFATLPMSSQHLATMASVLPAAYAINRFGRSEVFRGGALIGAFGFLVAAIGITSHIFLIMVLGGIFIGMHNAVGQFYRFVAAECVDKEFRGRAISLTIAGGVIASFLGPSIANFTKDLIYPRFSASYLSLVLLTLLGSYIASKLKFKESHADSGQVKTEDARPFVDIIRQPVFIVAVLACMLGFGEMTLLMTATPLAMNVCGEGFDATASVISWHMFCMFAPSFYTGDLIRRYGPIAVIMVGSILLLVSIAINLSGTSLMHFRGALMVLGISWNFMYVGGTTLLTRSYRPSEKSRVQGTSDTLVMATLAISSLAAGILENSYGWSGTNLAAIPGACVVIVSLVWLMMLEAKNASTLQVDEKA